MTPTNMYGMGEIVPYDGCKYDQIVSQLLSFPAPTVPFTGNIMADCPACCKGMGAFSMDGTGLFGTGLFADPFNFSTWGYGEIVALAFGAYMLYALTSTTKTEFRRASKGYRKLRTRKA